MCARKIWAGQGKNLLVTLASLGVLFAYFWLRGAGGVGRFVQGVALGSRGRGHPHLAPAVGVALLAP